MGGTEIFVFGLTFADESFMRVSKSAILNLNMVYSVEKNITASSLVRFMGTDKLVYVSRIYYKAMKQRLDERRHL